MLRNYSLTITSDVTILLLCRWTRDIDFISQQYSWTLPAPKFLVRRRSQPYFSLIFLLLLFHSLNSSELRNSQREEMGQAS